MHLSLHSSMPSSCPCCAPCLTGLSLPAGGWSASQPQMGGELAAASCICPRTYSCTGHAHAVAATHARGPCLRELLRLPGPLPPPFPSQLPHLLPPPPSAFHSCCDPNLLHNLQGQATKCLLLLLLEISLSPNTNEVAYTTAPPLWPTASASFQAVPCCKRRVE